MTSAEWAAAGGSVGGDVESLRALLTTATQHLLGDTISVLDERWRGPSRLPGWSRGHVATHLSRQADALGRLIQGARTGEKLPMYASSEQRDSEIEAGADRTGLELQIDLDTSAGALSDAFDGVEQDNGWDGVVEPRGGDQVALRLLPLARLCEVVLHHVDLDIGLDIGDVDQPTADGLIEWLAIRLAKRAGFPKIRVVTDSNLVLVVGSEGAATTVSGESAALLGWLTGRRASDGLDGAEGINLPAF